MMKTRSSSIGLKADGNECTTGTATTAAKVGNFNTTFSLPSFLKRVEKLSERQKIAIERTGFGNLLKIPRYKLSKNLLAELMDKWCPDKCGFVLFPRSSNNCSSSALTIDLMDIALILGLRVVGNPVTLHEDERFIELEQEYGAALWNRKISITSIEKRLDSIGDAVSEDFVRSFLLFIFGTVLFPTTNSKVDSRYLYLLQDLDKVCDFSWGAAVLADVMNHLCNRKHTNKQFVGGCLIFLQIWSYEYIDMARPSLLSSSITFPRACRWENSRPPRRQWVSTKFKELDKDQVIYKLQPTHEESNIDIVKELLEAQVDGEVLPAQKSNLEIDKVDDFRTRLIIMDQWIAEQAPTSKLTVVRQDQSRGQIEPSSTSATLTDYVELSTPLMVSEGQKCDIEPLISSPLILSENMDLCTPDQASDGQRDQIEHPPSTSQDDSLSVIMISDDDDEDTYIGRTEETSLEDNMQQKNETDYLREEIKRLKDQLEEKNAELKNLRDENIELRNMRDGNTELRNLRDENKILKDQLQERNAELDAVKQENLLISSSSNDLVTRLERIVLNTYDEDENEQSVQSRANGQ